MILQSAVFRSFATAAFLFALSINPLQASERRHGLSSFGDLKYPADFKHFDYVNPNAPKGGAMSTVGVVDILTFNHFNPFILKGDPAEGADFLLFDSLMARAADEPDAVYGLVAEAAEVADDKKSVTFYLRPEARFRDGSPLTADDVVFSFNIIKEKGSPLYQVGLQDVVEVKAIDTKTVVYKFKGETLRDLPLLVAQLPIFSKNYYATHDFLAETFEPPMGSGPYEVGAFDSGSYVTYKRRPDYWAANLPVNVGHNNFDEIRYNYYRERSIGLEAFKAHKYDIREEFTSKAWATEYKFPAVLDGRVKLLSIPDGTPSATQGFFINTRRPQFADPRVRKALGYAFDFEWTNKALFFDLYTRTQSYFDNTDLKAEGKPSPAELALLEPYRAKLPPEVFEEVTLAPKTDGSGRSKANIRMAAQLLDEAGWKLDNGVRKNAKGEELQVEFLIEDPTTQRIMEPYAAKLSELGIKVNLKRVDPAQEQVRLKTFDFDMMARRFSLLQTPGPELRNFWSSESAKQEGSYNLSGVSDPIVDALLQKVASAHNRDELKTACHALDRVLRASYYWVSNWYKPVHHIATWDVFSSPANYPPYDKNNQSIMGTWWYDKDKAAKIGG